MFGMGAAREQRENEYFFKILYVKFLKVYRQMPSLAIELWHPLPGEAMDTIISIRKSLDECEAALLRENPALAEKVEAAKTAANRCSTPCPKQHSAHAPNRCVQVFPNHFIGDFAMWRILEIGEKIESGDERYWPKDMAWSTVTESCIGSQVVRTDHVVRRKISDSAESAKPTHNSAMVQFTTEQLYGAAKDAGLHNADIDDLISVIGKQHQ